MKKTPLLLSLAWVICAALIAVMLLVSGCTPSLTREQLTPSPTPPGTPRPTRTLDPRQQVDNLATPDAALEQDAAATLLPAVSAIGPLLIEEFPLAREDAADLLPGSTEENEQFAGDLPEDIATGHQQIIEDAAAVDVEEANTALASSGYVLEAAEGGTLHLTQNGQTVEECLLPDAFSVWEEHWVLEMNGDVLFDGEQLTEQRVFDEVFTWQALAGREFFLYHQNDQYGMYFDGRSLPQRYQHIVRWDCADQQGQAFNFSAQGSEEAVGFFARKSGRWYYVRVTMLE